METVSTAAHVGLDGQKHDLTGREEKQDTKSSIFSGNSCFLPQSKTFFLCSLITLNAPLCEYESVCGLLDQLGQAPHGGMLRFQLSIFTSLLLCVNLSFLILL